jgi:hypothetical protein
MDAVGRLIPIDLTRADGQPFPRSVVTVLDRKGIAAEHKRDPVMGVAMPGRALPQRQALTADEHLVSPVKNVFSHRRGVCLPSIANEFGVIAKVSMTVTVG